MCEKQGRLRILVVDDEQKQRQILKILLNSEGYEVRTADSMETALERMAEKEPDIVITDPVSYTHLGFFGFFFNDANGL